MNFNYAKISQSFWPIGSLKKKKKKSVEKKYLRRTTFLIYSGLKWIRINNSLKILDYFLGYDFGEFYQFN